MKIIPFDAQVTAPADTANYDSPICNAILREAEIGHIGDISDADCAALTEARINDIVDEGVKSLVVRAQAKIEKIIAVDNLKLGTRPDGELRMLLVTRHDHLSAKDLATELGCIANYISDSGYYGCDIPTALTSLDIGEYGCWVFVVYDDQTKGFRADMQAMFTGMKWSEQEKAFDAFAKQYATAGVILSLDHASQGHLHAHDARLPNWNDNAFGRVGYNRFIKSPTEVKIGGKKQKLFPYGYASREQARWDAGNWDGADVRYGVVTLVG
jgi:hypothetical protein